MTMPHHTRADVAQQLDHAVLKPSQTDRDLAAAISMCLARGVGCLCVRPVDVAGATRLIDGGPLRVASVVGFPHGSHHPEIKVAEAARAIEEGAAELDMVMQIPAFLSGHRKQVGADIAAVVGEAKPAGVLVKVILETCLLTLDEVADACLIAEEAGADFVKTSTGFAEHGATLEAVTAMLEATGGRIGVKASGGIRDRKRAELFIGLGVTRIGNGYSSTEAICEGSGSGTGAY